MADYTCFKCGQEIRDTRYHYGDEMKPMCHECAKDILRKYSSYFPVDYSWGEFGFTVEWKQADDMLNRLEYNPLNRTTTYTISDIECCKRSKFWDEITNKIY